MAHVALGRAGVVCALAATLCSAELSWRLVEARALARRGRFGGAPAPRHGPPEPVGPRAHPGGPDAETGVPAWRLGVPVASG